MRLRRWQTAQCLTNDGGLGDGRDGGLGKGGKGPGGWPRRFVPASFIIRSPTTLYFPNAAPTMAESPVLNQQPPTVWRPGNKYVKKFLVKKFKVSNPRFLQEVSESRTRAQTFYKTQDKY